MGAISSLVINISANSAKYNRELDKARKSSKSFASSTKKQMKIVGGAFVAGGVVVAGALAKMTASTMASSQEISNLKRVANATTPAFMRMSYGARTFGVDQDKLSDILKDTNDRIGDFIQTGGGPMADFFENIGPKVGVTADQFARLSGPEALQLFYTSLERANLSQADMTFYMESIAGDLTLLQPLLADNGKQWSIASEKADRFGLVLSDLDLTKITNANVRVKEVKDMSQGFANVLTVAVAPGIEAISALWIDNSGRAQDWSATLTKGADFSITALGWVYDSVHGIGVVFTGLQYVASQVFRGLLSYVNIFYSRMMSSYNAVASVIPGITEIAENKIESLSESMKDTSAELLAKFQEDLQKPMPSGSLLATYDEIKNKYLTTQDAIEAASGRALEVSNVNTELEIANLNKLTWAYQQYANARTQQDQDAGESADAYRQYYSMRQKAAEQDQKKWLLNSEQRYQTQRLALAANGTAAQLGSLMSAFNSFAQAGEANSKKDFEKQKKWAKATAIVNAGAAIVRSFAEMPFFAALGASAVIGIKTAAQIRQINSQEYSGGSSISNVSGGGSGGGFTSSAPQEYVAPASQQGGGETHIHLSGNFTGIDADELGESIMNNFSEKINEGDYVFIEGGSRQAQELREAS